MSRLLRYAEPGRLSAGGEWLPCAGCLEPAAVIFAGIVGEDGKVALLLSYDAEGRQEMS